LQDPQVEALFGSLLHDAPCGSVEELTPDLRSMELAGDVKVVDECAPDEVRVELRVNEAEEPVVLVCDQRESGSV
jgi:hypothetical protein